VVEEKTTPGRWSGCYREGGKFSEHGGRTSSRNIRKGYGQIGLQVPEENAIDKQGVGGEDQAK